MTVIETFAPLKAATTVAVSRRRVLQVLAATALINQFAGVGDGSVAPASAEVAAWQPPPAYSRIVGLI
ncbi:MULTISPECIES: hypothetical protein [unclassified Nocardioides]|uniref:hypothetical protein n=1 Tax=unclassified Nocardioides TaxID=2615069 RepID=UPI0005A16A4E|nr:MULTISPECIES: hypothetical protein [unclassified Nocardioides]